MGEGRIKGSIVRIALMHGSMTSTENSVEYSEYYSPVYLATRFIPYCPTKLGSEVSIEKILSSLLNKNSFVSSCPSSSFLNSMSMGGQYYLN